MGRRSYKTLGCRQRHMLHTLVSRGGWHVACGWYWEGLAVTRKLLDSLVRNGFARVHYDALDGKQTYLPTEEAKAAVRAKGGAS